MTRDEALAMGKRIGEELLGSGRDAPDVVFSVEGIAEGVDEITLQCGTCSWWCEVQDVITVDGELICSDCLG